MRVVVVAPAVDAGHLGTGFDGSAARCAYGVIYDFVVDVVVRCRAGKRTQWPLPGWILVRG